MRRIGRSGKGSTCAQNAIFLSAANQTDGLPNTVVRIWRMNIIETFFFARLLIILFHYWAMETKELVAVPRWQNEVPKGSSLVVRIPTMKRIQSWTTYPYDIPIFDSTLPFSMPQFFFSMHLMILMSFGCQHSSRHFCSCWNRMPQVMTLPAFSATQKHIASWGSSPQVLHRWCWWVVLHLHGRI